MSTEEKSGKPRVKESQKEPSLLVKNKESDQTHLVLGVRAYDIFDDRMYAADVIADILGGGMSSRLWRIVRGEMGAAYYVRADNEALTDHGYLEASAGVNNSKLLPVVKAILMEFERLKKEKVGKEELEKAKKHMIGSLMLGLETSNAVAAFYGMQEILKREIISPEELAKRINSITAEQIKEAANDIFTNDKLNLTVIGPVEDERTLREALQIA